MEETTWHSVVVGINCYRDHKGFKHQPLSYAVKDAEAVSILFTQHHHEVTLLTDTSCTDGIVSHVSIKAKIQAACSAPKSRDTLILFFACHGIRRGSDSKPMLVCGDSRADDHETMIPIHW